MFITRGVLKGDVSVYEGYRIGGGISPYLSHTATTRRLDSFTRAQSERKVVSIIPSLVEVGSQSNPHWELQKRSFATSPQTANRASNAAFWGCFRPCEIVQYGDSMGLL